MEKYKRITDKRLRIGCFYEPKSKEERLDLVEIIGKQLPYENIYTRLAELEDKIENGTLVDTDKYYIKEEECVNGKVRYLICKYMAVDSIYDFADTEAEAEKKVKEFTDG